MAVNEVEVQEFVQKAFGDIGGMLTAAMVVIGDKLGLYKALAGGGPLTPADLAARTETAERYVREWCAAQAAAGYLTYDPATARYTLPEAHAAALVDEESPACMLGGFQGMSAATRATPKIIEAFRTGRGLAWHEHDPNLFEGTERFFRPGYNAHLVNDWIPALDGVRAKLDAGAHAADIGCGHGASTIIMAKAFPRSTFVGFDYHAPSIESARRRAREAGVGDRVRFEVAAAKDYPGSGYDLVCFFDCLHDMGDPVGAARHVRESLAADGTWLLVEPFANDRVEDNRVVHRCIHGLWSKNGWWFPGRRARGNLRVHHGERSVIDILAWHHRGRRPARQRPRRRARGRAVQRRIRFACAVGTKSQPSATFRSVMESRPATLADVSNPTELAVGHARRGRFPITERNTGRRNGRSPGRDLGLAGL